MKNQSKPLEKRFGWKEVSWKTAIKMGLGNHFLPLGPGAYFMARDVNKGKPTFSGSIPYHFVFTFVPYAAPSVYFLDKYLNR